MKIFVKDNNVVLNHQLNRKVSKPAARRDLSQRVREEELKATGKDYRGRVDQGDATKNYREYKRSLDKTNPETLDVATKNMMWKRAKQLKDIFVVGMLSRDELHPVKQFEFNGVMKTVVDESRMAQLNSVQRNVAWTRKNDKYVKEFKNIMRHLNPENPMAGDIEKFRPTRHGRV